MYNIHLLPARFGDAILIEYGLKSNPKYILIDGGPYFGYEETFSALKKVAKNIKKLELLVVTHIDIDHIDGIIKFLNQDEIPLAIEDIWFNGWGQINDLEKDKLGGVQGEYLSALLKHKKLPHNKSFNGEVIMLEEEVTIISLDGGMNLTLLSPMKSSLERLKKKWEKTVKAAKLTPGMNGENWIKLKEDGRYAIKEEETYPLLGDPKVEKLAKAKVTGDSSPANASSIAFIAEYEGKNCLFAGDAQSKTLKYVLKKYNLLKDGKLSVDAWKLSHHGSKKSTLLYLMEMIESKRLLVSSNGERFEHPDPETIAKFLSLKRSDLKFYFNYKTDFNESWDSEYLKGIYDYETFYPDGNGKGISVSL